MTKAEMFYAQVLDILLKNQIPFMVGGTYAFNAYTGMNRETKDMDIIVTKKNCLKILRLLEDSGFATEFLDPVWIGKIYHDDYFVDVIFAERNNIYKVKDSWFDLARKGKILGKTLLLMPIEYMISTKAYVKFREKYDGSDINYLLLKYAKDINWHVLITQVSPHWQLLFAHLLMFAFVFPNSRDTIPSWVIKKYIQNTKKYFTESFPKTRTTRGQLISYEYAWAIEKWQYMPVYSQ